MKKLWIQIDKILFGKYSGWISGFVYLILAYVLTWIGRFVSGNIWVGVSVSLFLLVVLLGVVIVRQRFLLNDFIAFKAGRGFHIIRLDELNPDNITSVTHSELPKGMIWLRGVKFFIASAQENNETVAKVVSVRPTAANAANLVDIHIGIDQVLEVYLLITTNYGVKSFRGAQPGDTGDRWDEKLAGHLEPIFDDGTSEPKFDLRLGHDIRDFHYGNQPDAIDTLKKEGATSFQVWHSSQNGHTLDMIIIKINDQSKKLDRIRLVAQMEAGSKPLALTEGGNLIHEPAYPELQVFGVTCRTEENH